MALSSDKINQYRKLLSFVLTYWNSDLLSETASNAMGADIDAQQVRDYDQSPEELADDLEEMGPTYIKLGQLLSTRPDLLPDPYLDALSDLQDDAEPIDFDTVQEIVEEELGTEISKAFAHFDEEPLASASIGQVHKATIRSGKEVVVKVQRPGIREQFFTDLEVLQEIVDWAVEHTETARKFALDELVSELQQILTNELNYSKEAQNLIRIHENLKDFKHLTVPLPVDDYSTSKILTMEFMDGKKVVSLSPLKQIEMHSEELADEFVEAYLKQVMVDGFLHADPHPGNIHLTKENKLALLDLGMVAHISAKNREHLLQFMAALSEDSGEKVGDILLDMSTLRDDYDEDRFRKTVNYLVMESQNATASEMKTGRMLIQMNQSAAQNGIKLPTEVNILGKVLLNLDQIISKLDPEFDMRGAIRKHIWKLMEKKMKEEIKPENFLSVLVEAKKLAEHLPERLNKITKKLAENELEIKVDAIDEKRLTDGFQKVANRITLGLIIAATIIGAAMLMNVPTDFTVFGYPGLAMIFFLLAATGGVLLTYYIIFKDEDFR
ncbi:ABC1 kinase family protein [Gracilimonas mengyeensis]|uniref:Predicted unusual protein kinase regulating ubiquinone biosynthesis, AarF/ABC1/UbiB family n=1 Tax=Gracilimonas mengyeensis TaxID=1302730 RepID=A0A521FCG4_9BACT|nr:AarF/UbiB family protein [Gracilimonas mengyeensis]SMO93849.1 Predicted unusual protein kinase regulating ubiquinone biosynthesis, AarF/ABC1/UbiB family [Gracilimonas mengyeensis]